MPSEATPTTTGPTTHPTRLFSLAEVLRIMGAAIVAGIAVGYLLTNYDGATANTLARIFAIVAMTAMLHLIFEARRRCHIDKVDERLDRIETKLGDQLDAELRAYARAYLDHKDRNG